MSLKVGSEPGGLNAVHSQFTKQKFVIYHVETHLLRSIRHSIETSPLSVAARMRSVTDSRAVSVECRGRKPCWVAGCGQEMIFIEIMIELLVDDSLYNLHDYRN